MEKKKKRIIIIICYSIAIIGIGVLSFNYIKEKINLTFETVNLQMYGNTVPKNVKKEPQEIKEEPKQESEANNNNNNYQKITYDYIGYIDIPKINLVQGFVSIDSKYNDADKNIQIIRPSDYPDVDKGNFILAAHSGSASISYFKKLYLVNVGDYVHINYNNARYDYRIVKIYNVPKNGQAVIYRDREKTVITLITCTKNDNSSQTIYIGELEHKQDL